MLATTHSQYVVMWIVLDGFTMVCFVSLDVSSGAQFEQSTCSTFSNMTVNSMVAEPHTVAGIAIYLDAAVFVL